jgi:dipeptide/tripeptide permease
MLLFGDAYAFDNPQPLQTNIEQDLDISHTSFNFLYSCYSFPNMILPLFGGFLIDFLGVRVAIFLFSTLLIIGQLIVTYGGFAKVFLAILSRLYH